MIHFGLIQDLFQHMEWADARLWRAVLEFDAAANDADLGERLLHLHQAQRAFFDVWRELPVAPNFGAELAIPQLAQWAQACHREVQDYIASLPETALDRPVQLPWAARMAGRFGRQPSVTTLGETALQVVLHSTYHRAQAALRLKQLGSATPLTDYIAWLWLARPAPDWPPQGLS